jgi:FdhD protein
LSNWRNTNTIIHEVLMFEEGNCENDFLEMISEEPLMLRINEKPYSVVMRTPGEERFHAAGLFLGESIIDSHNDFSSIGYDDHSDANIVDIWLTPERRNKIHHLLKRQVYVSQTSCGICGKKMIQDLYQTLKPAKKKFKINPHQIFNCVNTLFDNQNYHPRTHSSHAAVLFDDHLDMMTIAEDVGRHNALDKAIGKVFMEKNLSNASLAVMSSRISYELVQKAARANIPMIVSKSRPTALAVEMAKRLNMTLVSTLGSSKLFILCGHKRIQL